MEILTRFFARRRRHDIEALTAYGAHRSTSTQRFSRPTKGDRLRRPARPCRDAARTTTVKPARPRVSATTPSTAASACEGEGGAAAQGAGMSSADRIHRRSVPTLPQDPVPLLRYPNLIPDPRSDHDGEQIEERASIESEVDH